MFRTRTLVALLVVAAIAAAPVFAQDTGRADFSRFVALGDSLGAGYVSAGLVRGAQEDSVPALVAKQANGQDIAQPLISDPGIPGLLQLKSLSPLVIDAIPSHGLPINLNYQGLYQNLSVPGFNVGDALRTRTGNDLIDIILRGLGTQLELALAQQPTFAIVWLGNNDVLGAATAGRVIEGVTLTPVAQFDAEYRSVVGALKAAGADLVLATVPDVTAIPYVTTIPPVLVDPATNQPVTIGGNLVPLLGPNGPLSLNDRVLLPASQALAQGIGIPAAAGGTGQPLPDSLVLSAGEIGTIRARLNAFNQIIRDVANATDSALVDIGAVLTQGATTGFDFGGITFNSDFVTGGLISLDGVHPTPLGYAIAANAFIDAINDHYGANIPPVDLYRFIFGSDASAIPTIPGASISGFVFTRQAGKQLNDVLRFDRPSTGGNGGGGNGGGGRDGQSRGQGIGAHIPTRIH